MRRVQVYGGALYAKAYKALWYGPSGTDGKRHGLSSPGLSTKESTHRAALAGRTASLRPTGRDLSTAVLWVLAIVPPAFGFWLVAGDVAGVHARQARTFVLGGDAHDGPRDPRPGRRRPPDHPLRGAGLGLPGRGHRRGRRRPRARRDRGRPDHRRRAGRPARRDALRPPAAAGVHAADRHGLRARGHRRGPPDDARARAGDQRRASAGAPPAAGSRG